LVYIQKKEGQIINWAKTHTIDPLKVGTKKNQAIMNLICFENDEAIG
jgi:hypothetical protein